MASTPLALALRTLSAPGTKGPFLAKIALTAIDVQALRLLAVRWPQEADPVTNQREMIMSSQSALAEKSTILNGLDVDAAAATIAAIKADKSLARFQFRARNTWITGGENRSAIKDFYGAGREDKSRMSSFEFINGEPPVLLGDNEGANPVEFLLHALAGCVTTTFVLHAMARGIAIEELSTELAGDLDVQGLLGLDDRVSPGYQQIRIMMHVKADCSEEALDDLLAYAQQHSPVCSTVCRPVPVIIERVAA
jgi:uncharacterized OsmC-like protein